MILQPNAGAAATRNKLCKIAKGDFIAFLDADDIWHPRYLECQLKLHQKNPEAVGYFTGHLDFYGDGQFEWNKHMIHENENFPYSSLSPAAFLSKYNESPAQFSSMSYFCIPRNILNIFGNEPFKANGAEDSYLFNLLPTVGNVIYAPVELVAYRIREGSMSSDLLRCIGARVEAFELLLHKYANVPPDLERLFTNAFAAHQRFYGKLLMGAGQIGQARIQFTSSYLQSSQLSSRIKSIIYLVTTYLPIQPSWPSSRRNYVKD